MCVEDIGAHAYNSEASERWGREALEHRAARGPAEQMRTPSGESVAARGGM